MQLSIDTETLEAIFTHAKAAARIVSYIDNTIVVGALSKSINEISRMVGGLLGRLYAPQLVGKLTQDHEYGFDIVKAIDGLRQVMARADAVVNAAESLLDDTSWSDGVCDRRRLERLAHLVGATFDTVQAAMELGDRIAVELARRGTVG